MGRVVLLLAPMILAGCVDPFARSINCKEYLEAHTGEGALVIVVTVEPGGPPLSDAQVTVKAWGTCWQRNERATTPSDGVVSWALPAWGYATVSVEAADMTTERLESIPLAPDGDTFTLNVPLFRNRLNWTTKGAFTAQPPGALPIVGGNTDWDAQPISWQANRETMREYARRLVAIDVSTHWNNTQITFADLAIGLGPNPGRVDFVIDSDADQSGIGAFSESGSLGAGAMYEAGWSEATEILIGALSQKPHLALSPGIPYTLSVTAFFSSPRSADTPLPLWALMAALILSAIALRRVRGG